MARWKLATPHYLNTVEPNEWEYKETDRKTGREKRMRIPVPRYFSPNDPSDWNNRWGGKDNEDGEVIVCQPGKGEDRDYAFLGDPSPNMIPIDDEAKEISASFAERWKYKSDIETPGSYSQSLIDKFQVEAAAIAAKPVEIPGLSDLVAAISKQSEVIGEVLKRRV